MQINVLEYLEKTIQTHKDKIAYTSEVHEISFDELYKSSQRIGTTLIDYSTKNDPIVVLSEKSIDTIRMYLGVLYAGCFYVPIDTEMPLSRIKVIADTVKANVILTDEASYELAHEIANDATVIKINESLTREINKPALEKRRSLCLDTDPAYVIFTSGSTGAPKGVIGSQRALIDYIDAVTESFIIEEHDILGNQSPLDYIAGIRDIYLPLKTGATTCIIPKKLFAMPKKLFDYLDEKSINTVFWVAPAISLCAETNAFEYKVPTLNKVIFTGSVLPCRHLRVWQQNLPKAKFINHYGPTEITASCTYYIVEHFVDDEEVLPIGIPFKNTGILLLDENDKAVENGELGEICVKGSCLALGYFSNQEQTNKVFINNPLNPIYDEKIYRTGDLGRIREDGHLEFHGRTDNQIKHMGHRIELGEIEVCASSMPEIKHCSCQYHAEQDHIYIFYVGDADKKMLATYLRKRLPGYMIPRKFIQLDEMPKLDSGKLDVKSLIRNFAT